ncbi:hypothetical protein GGR50DRAFT_694061 [Xylaria sp. CBS 124048]|nr:hypothetical protein GGR50DRAFT_694061 [Xylaria sp. CBS 124048]
MDLFDGFGTRSVRLVEPCECGLSKYLVALYQGPDGLNKKNQLAGWHEDVITYYYAGIPEGVPTKKFPRCYISGVWWSGKLARTAGIVPSFSDNEAIGGLLFGSWTQCSHLIVLEMCFSRAALFSGGSIGISSLLCPSIPDGHTGKELDEKELTFLNGKRPVLCFLYLHFIMALVYIKDINRFGWQDVWVKYYQERAFPRLRSYYMRRSMLLAIGIYFGKADLAAVMIPSIRLLWRALYLGSPQDCQSFTI